MMTEEEDLSMVNEFRKSTQIAVEAREMQKRRILICNIPDDDDDWSGYT